MVADSVTQGHVMVAKKAVKKKKTASKAAKAPTGLLAHFTGPKNRDTCIAELLNQELIVGDRAIATAIYEKSRSEERRVGKEC